MYLLLKWCLRRQHSDLQYYYIFCWLMLGYIEQSKRLYQLDKVVKNRKNNQWVTFLLVGANLLIAKITNNYIVRKSKF